MAAVHPAHITHHHHPHHRINSAMPPVSPIKSRPSSSFATANHGTRPRTAPGKRSANFRPLPYQVSAEIDAFFGLSRERKRELALRYREGGAVPAGFVVGHGAKDSITTNRVKIVGADGIEEPAGKKADWIWFDSIERDEFQCLLAASAPTSPTTPAYVPPSPMSSCGSRRRSSLASARALSPSSALGLDLGSFPFPPEMDLASFGPMRRGSVGRPSASGLVSSDLVGLGLAKPSSLAGTSLSALSNEPAIRTRPRRSHSVIQRSNVVGSTLPRLPAAIPIQERFAPSASILDDDAARDPSPLSTVQDVSASATPIRMPAFLPHQRRKANAKELDEAFGRCQTGAPSSDAAGPLDTSFGPTAVISQDVIDGEGGGVTLTSGLMFRDPFASSSSASSSSSSTTPTTPPVQRSASKRRPAPLQLRSNLSIHNASNLHAVGGPSPLSASPRSAGLEGGSGTPNDVASSRHRRPFSVAGVDSPTLERLRSAMSLDVALSESSSSSSSLFADEPSSSTHRRPRPSHGSGSSNSPTKAHALLGLNAGNRTLLAPGGLPTGREVYDDVDIPCASVRLSSDDEDDGEDDDDVMSDGTHRAAPPSGNKPNSVGKLWGRMKKSLK